MSWGLGEEGTVGEEEVWGDVDGGGDVSECGREEGGVCVSKLHTELYCCCIMLSQRRVSWTP